MDGMLTRKHACLAWWLALPGVGAPWAGGLWALDVTAAAPCPPSPPVTAFEQVTDLVVVRLARCAATEAGLAGRWLAGRGASAGGGRCMVPGDVP